MRMHLNAIYLFKYFQVISHEDKTRTRIRMMLYLLIRDTYFVFQLMCNQ